ncbi:MAG: ABC transporter permease [Peptococcaceae bacterium]|jgi:putative ABC transport system permease protein|nr:ABC transporter permease [Peptococcaceae bacterium]MEE0206144.1 ABC transporter permease [Peptococcaceae bacterium]
MELVLSTVAQGLLWAVLAIGLFITFRILDIADLSIEGTYPLGGAIAVMTITGGGSPLLAVIFAFFGGCIAGAVTGFLHTKLKIPALLAGILTMIGLYSINLRIMGRATTSILGEETVYSFFENNMSKVSATLIVGLLATLVVWFFCYIFFGTELGAAIRATGDNPQMIRAQGINTDVTIMLGLIISNGFVGVTGALLSQSNGYADVNMGTGVLVTGLASIIIGEVLFGTRSFKNWLISVVLGSIVYRAVVAFVLWLGMNPNDLKLLTAVIVAVALALPLIKSKMQKLRSNM